MKLKRAMATEDGDAVEECTEALAYKVFPHVDQGQMYKAVSAHLVKGTPPPVLPPAHCSARGVRSGSSLKVAPTIVPGSWASR